MKYFICVVGNLDMTEAQLICSDLEQAVDDGLVLSSYLHLFYLLTPYSAVEELKIDRQVTISVVIFFNLFFFIIFFCN